MPDKEIMLQIRAREEQCGWNAFDMLVRNLPDDTPPSEVELRDALVYLAEDWRATADLYDKAKLKGAKTTYVDPLRHAARQLDTVIEQLGKPRRAPLGQLQPVSTVQDPCNIVMKPHAPHVWTHPDGNIGVLHCPGVGRTRERVEQDAGLDEAPHRFEPSVALGDGTCIAIVERGNEVDGSVLENCGRYASHPAHRLQGQLPVGSPAGLDALIADSVGEHGSIDLSGMVSAAEGSDPSAADRLAAFPDVSGMFKGIKVVIDEGAPQATPMQPLGDVAAYLRGDIDELPGGEPLQPRRAVGGELPGGGTWSAEIPADATVLRPGVFAMNTATEILESHDVTSPSTLPPGVPPVPLLGQPGDAGAGYDHTYIPPGGVPATFTELLTPVPAAFLPPHISHSQIETAGECPAKYRLQRLPSAVEGTSVPQIPQWANIGGNAFHRWVEAYERGVASGMAMAGQPGHGAFTEADARFEWDTCFTAECQEIEASQPVPRSRWRAAKQGAEGETWWNANGPKMIENYLKARPAERSADLGGKPAIELELTVPVFTAYGAIDYKAIIDRVTARDEGQAVMTLVIRDYKTGDRMPDSYQQLGEYANVLRLLGVPPSVKIVGTYFNARKGVWTPEVDLDERYPAEWFVYLVTTGHAGRVALTQGPTPARPSSFCGGCSVRWACPVKAGKR